jgi:osmotically inducible protein OsmC
MLHAMKKDASAVWLGDLRTGDGTLRSGSGLLDNTPYTWATRFEDTPGTTPEELVAGAHAACFTMALCSTLNQAGFHVTRLATFAEVSFDQQDGRWSVTRSALNVTGRVPGIDAARFAQLAEDARSNCPISRLLRAEITLEASLDLRSDVPLGIEPEPAG